MTAAMGMNEPWGKLDRSYPDVATAPRLSLVAHCIDVAAVSRALICLPTWRKRLERLADQPLTQQDVDRLTVLAFMHDVGKAGAGFYSKALPATERVAWLHRCGADLAQCGHTKVVAPLLRYESRYTEHRAALGIEAWRGWGGSDPAAQDAALNMWLAAVSHHGEPISTDSLRDTTGEFRTWTQPISGYDPLHGLLRLGEVAHKLWPDAFGTGSATMPHGEGLIHAFAGLVSLADWIGSNTAAEFFPYDLGPQDERRWPIAWTRAQQALRDMRIDVEAARSDLRARSPRFEQVFAFAPTAV